MLYILTRTLELLVVQVGHVLALELAGRVAARVRGQPGCILQIARQPRQMTVARERILRQAQRPQPGHPGEHVPGKCRDVVVVERAGRWKRSSKRMEC